MMISTRGRYVLRVMADLASHADDGFVPMKDVALRQELSLKYVEKLMPVLTKNGLVEGVHGKGGGYRLKKAPADCTVGEILRLTEGTLAPVACLQEGAERCARAGDCRTLPMWKNLDRLISDFFDKTTLADLLTEKEI